mmetsp:Transcript_14467/g.26185  ORF Transcript_14467/g.26185 Transcript_14467/m.26185 type:complete len:246 (+) Transcript_14467:1796-2533(+)
MTGLEVFLFVHRNIFPAILKIGTGRSSWWWRSQGLDCLWRSWCLSWNDSTYTIVIDKDIAPYQVKTKLSHVLRVKGVAVGRFRRLLNHDCVISTVISHIQILFRHNFFLLVTLLNQLFRRPFSKMRHSCLSIRNIRIYSTLWSRVDFSSGFLFFVNSICHGQTISRQDTAITMNKHFGHSQGLCNGTCMLWSSSPKTCQCMRSDIKSTHLSQVSNRPTHGFIRHLQKAVGKFFDTFTIQVLFCRL